MSPDRFLFAPALVAAFVIAAGCSGETDAPPASSTPAKTKSAFCEAPAALPGSLPLPDSIRDSIELRNLPATDSGRTICNRLALEPGAYAQRHAIDPIDWRPWSNAAFQEATKLGRPLLVLTGSSACSACDELRRDAMHARRLARDINRYFVPVLVDREQRPDVDAYLMLATQVLTGGAGWPAVVFLLGEGKPFEAQSWGAAATAATADRTLARLVEDVRRRIELGGGTIEERAEATMEKMQQRTELDTTGEAPDTRRVASALRGYVADSFDPATGAFGTPPLFPRPSVVTFLLRRARAGDADAANMATTALDRLAASPLADAESGGFFRFAKQAAWQEPERVKLLADNAVLASAYFDAADFLKDARMLATARRTADFLIHDLAREDGSLAASVDATAKLSVHDDRVLADANGLAVSALVRAATATGDTGYMDAAVAAAKVLDERLRDEGFVSHCLESGGHACTDGYLADQVFVALAFLDLAEAGAPGGDRWLAAARTIAETLPQKFGHEATGAFFQTREGSQALPLRLEPALDRVVPSGNSAAAMLYARLAARTKEPRYAAQADRVFRAFSETLALRPLTLPAMVVALDYAVSASAPPQLDPAPAVQP